MPPSPPPPGVSGDDQPWPTVSVVLPALNEEGNLPLVLEGLPPVDEIIVVDGGSTDDTVAVAREVRPEALVIRQTRTGKGNALLCGFAACSSDIVVTLNADGSTDPGELPRYVDALLAGAEVAHGSRYREGGANLDEGTWDRLGRRGFNQLVNVFFGTRFTDLGFGYNAYWRVLLPVLDLPDPDARTPRRGTRLWGEGPEIEPLINIRMATQGLRVVEVASVGYPRIYGDREHHPVRDGARAFRTAAGEYLRRWQISRQAARHPGVHAFREERRALGRRAAHHRAATADQSAGPVRGALASGGRHAADRRDRAPWAEQSWRESYADPGALTGDVPRSRSTRRNGATVPGMRTGFDGLAGPGIPAGSGVPGVPAGSDRVVEAPRRTRASRRAGRRVPDLTVITGNGTGGGAQRQSPYLAPLRAVPGEAYDRE